MGCRVLMSGPNVMAIACTRGRQLGPCSTPGCTRAASRLCDYPLTQLEVGKEPKTCDRKLCDRCAVRVGPNRDYCGPHAKLAKESDGNVR